MIFLYFVRVYLHFFSLNVICNVHAFVTLLASLDALYMLMPINVVVVTFPLQFILQFGGF